MHPVAGSDRRKSEVGSQKSAAVASKRRTSAPANPDFSNGENVDWIPDEEVRECPICSRKFQPFLVPKHHCRACGRVVCGSCSNNSIYLPSKGSKQRVCDPCHEWRKNDKSATLTENLSNNRQVEISLKSDLKDKHQQAEWFKHFLVQIAGEANVSASNYVMLPSPRGQGGSLESSVVSVPSVEEVQVAASAGADGDAARLQASSGMLEDLAELPDSLRAAIGGLADSEVQFLIVRARRRWHEVCAELAAAKAENGRLLEDCEALDRECHKSMASEKELNKAIKNMEKELNNRAMHEALRDQLRLKTIEQQEELDGLKERILTLEATRPSSQGSFLSGLRGASFTSDMDGSRGSCTERCTERLSFLRARS